MPVTEAARFVADLIPRLLSDVARLAIIVPFAALFVPAPPALAQNLVQDPFFANGLTDYQTTGFVGIYQVTGGPPRGRHPRAAGNGDDPSRSNVSYAIRYRRRA